MIERIIISGYRCFSHLDMAPDPGLNIIVGDNESGKSTLLEAINLGLTGRINGRWMGDELNPYWFNTTLVREFFAAVDKGEKPLPPQISIELYFTDDDLLQPLRGVHNSERLDCPGVRVNIEPSSEYAAELAAYCNEPGRPNIIPVEYYDAAWHTFEDGRLLRRPRTVGVSMIDSRTIRSSSTVDHHTRLLINQFIKPSDRAAISVAYRRARHEISDNTLVDVNDRITVETGTTFSDLDLGLQMDQSSAGSWESSIIPQTKLIPFTMAGQGKQVMVKMALAMARERDSTSHVLVEEPENHLSHTSLTRLIGHIRRAAGNRQVFVTTHSSYVANRLGLDKLRFLHGGKASQLSDLSADTVEYFRKLPGYDTLRLVLANRLVLVEGPSDAMVLERAFHDRYSCMPADGGIDVLAANGVALARGLELCAVLGRDVIALRDNDGKPASHWTDKVSTWLADDKRQLIVSEPDDGHTLESQVVNANGDDVLRAVLDLDPSKQVEDWMLNNKTDAALKIATAQTSITYPRYIQQVVEMLK